MKNFMMLQLIAIQKPREMETDKVTADDTQNTGIPKTDILFITTASDQIKCLPVLLVNMQ